MFSAIGRFFGSFGIVKALTGWITPIVIMSIVVAILTMGYFVNKQFNEFKADLVTQGKKQAEFDKLKEATDKLSNEIKLLKASNQVTIDETQKLRQDLNNVQEAAKIRQVTVKKKVDALRLDKTMDPLTKEREISRVYADSLRDSQCRILPELCQSAQPKAEVVEESIIDGSGITSWYWVTICTVVLLLGCCGNNTQPDKIVQTNNTHRFCKLRRMTITF